MPSQQATKKLIKYIDEAVAMEQNVLRMLDSMIRTTEDPEAVRVLERHKQTTRGHIERLEQRLKMHGSSPSRTKQVGGIVGARLKSAVDVARRDKAGRNARDAFVTEQLEVASYELLERVARLAGDDETAGVARQNRAEDEAMARRLADDWDKVAELSVQGGRDGGERTRLMRERAKELVGRARQNPLVLGAGATAAGFFATRRLRQRSGGQQQQEAQQTGQQADERSLELLTKADLQKRAEAQGIEVRRGMTKQEIIDAIRAGGAPGASKANPIEVQNFLAGVSYPLSTEDLVSEAARQGADERIRATLERLPAQQFNTPAEVSSAIGELS